MIYPTAKISERTRLVIGQDSFIGDFCLITVPKLVVLEGSQINAGSKIIGREECLIGKHVVISYNVVILTSSDTIADRMDDSSPEDRRNIVSKPVIIDDYAYVGANSVIMPGVKIREYSVIGALSYLPENFETEPYGVYYGQPVKFIKRRLFNDTFTKR